MSDAETVGVAELRQHLSRHLKRVRAGERLVVTERNRPVATLGPPPGSESPLERLVAEGRLTPPALPWRDDDPVDVRASRPDAASDDLRRSRAE